MEFRVIQIDFRILSVVWSVSNHQDQPTSQPIDRLSLVQIVRWQREDEDEPSPDNDYYLFIIHGLAA